MKNGGQRWNLVIIGLRKICGGSPHSSKAVLRLSLAEPWKLLHPFCLTKLPYPQINQSIKLIAPFPNQISIKTTTRQVHWKNPSIGSQGGKDGGGTQSQRWKTKCYKINHAKRKYESLSSPFLHLLEGEKRRRSLKPMRSYSLRRRGRRRKGKREVLVCGDKFVPFAKMRDVSECASLSFLFLLVRAILIKSAK